MSTLHEKLLNVTESGHPGDGVDDHEPRLYAAVRAVVELHAPKPLFDGAADEPLPVTEEQLADAIAAAPVVETISYRRDVLGEFPPDAEPQPADEPVSVPPPVDALLEHTRDPLVDALTKLIDDEAFCPNCDSGVLRARDMAKIKTAIDALWASGVAEGHRQRDAERAPIIIETTVKTLRTAAGWVSSDEDSDMLRTTAETVERQGADELCCPVCEEVECDEGCPLDELRAEAGRESNSHG